MIGRALRPSLNGLPTHSLADILPSVAGTYSIPGYHNTLGLPAGKDTVLLLVDGLGATLIREHADTAPTLSELVRSTLRAGFPASTASSITSLSVGAQCGIHGIIGYQFRPQPQAATVNALRWTLHNATGPTAVDVYPPERMQPMTGILSALDTAGIGIIHVTPAEHYRSGLTRAAFRKPSTHLPASTAQQVRDTILKALTRPSPGPRFVYAYYGRLDTVGHFHGPESSEWLDTLRVVDTLVADLAAGLPTDSTLLVTGDHGMIRAGNHMDIDTDPDLLDGVCAVAGETRVRHLYTRPGASKSVQHTWSDWLGPHAYVATRDEAIDHCWFGPFTLGTVEPRIGDLIAVALDDTVLTRSCEEPTETLLIGHHGAFTPAEQLVPVLIRAPGP
ncbi:alkaline phosphatase family protein [Nocardia brasiliensis]|uniref:alkaline phosphatase family protein n=1 Tax=Nocardia brasiliensis TaxID=37326 RepID=UPI002456CD92|nr:alkaline phosphatase family protein [Nocardia brasiliensis]